MIRQLNGKEQVFKLKTADNQVWGFSATEEVYTWLKPFAEIMQLKTDDCTDVTRKIFFLALKEDNLPPNHNKPDEFWNLYKQGSVYRIWTHDKIPETFVELNKDFLKHDEIKYINMWSSLRPIYKYYINNGGGPIHAASAELNGKGILIAASGGTGKSTCSIRLPDYWNSMVDDTALVVKNKNNQYCIHPMPTWSDHLWNKSKTVANTSHSVPLSAIFFLEQSKEDSVIPLTNSSAVQKLFESNKQTWENFWEKIDLKEKQKMRTSIFNNVFEMAREIPCYTLNATLHGKFWEEIEKVL